MVRRQYSGNVHRVICGIGLVNGIYIPPETGQFWIIDYRLFDPERDGKSKVDHVEEMLNGLMFHQALPFSTVLMEAGMPPIDGCSYSIVFKNAFTVLLKDRVLKEVQHSHYTRVCELSWNDEKLSQG